MHHICTFTYIHASCAPASYIHGTKIHESYTHALCTHIHHGYMHRMYKYMHQVFISSPMAAELRRRQLQAAAFYSHTHCFFLVHTFIFFLWWWEGVSTTWAWHGGLVGLDNPEVVRAAVSVGWMDLVPLLGEIDFVSTVMIFIDFTQRSLMGWSSKITSDEGWGWTRRKYNHVF